MNPNLRALLLSAALLAIFLTAALLLQSWLQRRAEQVRADAAHAAAERLLGAYALSPRAPDAWDEDYRARLGAIVGGTVELTRVESARDTPANLIAFSRALPGHAGWEVHARLPAPALDRLQLAYQRALAALTLLGVLLALVPLLAMLFSTARREIPGSRAPWRAEAAGLEQFARLSVERGAALEREQTARARAEENFQVSQSLLDRSLDERVRLGRELHDNISQTLYAVSLTLESVGKNATLPTTSEQRLAQSVHELRRLNREVRAYIRELEPGNLHGESFAVALSTMLAGVTTPGVSVEQRVQDEASRLIPRQYIAELVNLVREAVSNSIRHGQATHLSIRAAYDNGTLALVIADNGCGFAAEARTPGHGLVNMRARAAALGGEFAVESAPGKGTRVLVTLPLNSSDS